MCKHPIRLALCFTVATWASYSATDSAVSPSIFQYSGSVKVAYDVQGTGDVPVVALHSLGSAKESWNALTPGLLPICACRIYRLDLKGHGETSIPDDHRYSLHENAAIVRAFMRYEGLQHAILLGHSYGGAVALDIALDAKKEDPGLLRGLILIGPPGVIQRFPFIAAQQRFEVYGKIVDHITTPKIRAWIAVHATSYGNSPGVRNRVQLDTRLWGDPGRSRAARETARQFLDGGGLRELASRDHDTGVPTLVIAGKHDRVVGLKHIRELGASIRGAKLFVIPNAGHAPHEDMPESVVPLVSEFLRTMIVDSALSPKL